MKPVASDIAHWPQFARLFREAAERVGELGRGVTAWDLDAFRNLSSRIVEREQRMGEVTNDQFVFNTSCIDPPRGASRGVLIEALRARDVKDPEILIYTDLAKRFQTSSLWSLLLAQDQVPRDPEEGGYGPLSICFLKQQSPACLSGSGKPADEDQADARTPFELIDLRIYRAGGAGQPTLLLIKTCTEHSGDGDCGIQTTLYAYDKAADRFDRVFRNVTGRNRNELTRFVDSGPIRGHIIVTYPTDDAPYAYWVEVHRRGDDGKYARILRYRGKTAYGDGNPLAVADSEMPELLSRLHLWKAGDVLPAPENLPSRCTTLFMKKGVQWCK